MELHSAQFVTHTTLRLLIKNSFVVTGLQLGSTPVRMGPSSNAQFLVAENICFIVINHYGSFVATASLTFLLEKFSHGQLLLSTYLIGCRHKKQTVILKLKHFLFSEVNTCITTPGK